MRDLVYAAVMLALLTGCSGNSPPSSTSDGQSKFTSTVSKGVVSVKVIKDWKPVVGELGITLRHPNGAHLSLMLNEEELPKSLYDELLSNDKDLRELVEKNGNPSLNKKTGWKLERYQFNSPAGDGYLMVTHPPDNVRNTNRGLSGNTWGKPLVLITGGYGKDETSVRKEIEAMIATLRVEQPRQG